MTGAQEPDDVYTKHLRIAQQARTERNLSVVFRRSQGNSWMSIHQQCLRKVGRERVLDL